MTAGRDSDPDARPETGGPPGPTAWLILDYCTMEKNILRNTVPNNMSMISVLATFNALSAMLMNSLCWNAHSN